MAHGLGAGKMNYLKVASSEIVKDGLTLWVDGHDFSNPDSTTTLRDRSGFGNNGICANFAYTSVSGSTTDSGIFVGGNDIITIADAPSLSSDYITVEAKIHIGGAYAVATATMVAKDNNAATPWRFGLTGTGGVIIFIGASVVMYSASTFPLNTTIHLGWTYDGVNSIVYADGEINNSLAYNVGALPQSTDPAFIGNVGTTARPLDNTIYTARIYNRALTPAEMKQNYSADKNNS